MQISNGSFQEHQTTTLPRTGTGEALASGLTQASPPSERILVACPSCTAILSIRRVHARDGVRCKQCNQKFLVPETAGAKPTPVCDGVPSALPVSPEQTDVSPASRGTKAAHWTLLNQLNQFITAHEELRAAHDQLRAERDELRGDRDRVSARLYDATSELYALKEVRVALVAAEAELGRLRQEFEKTQEAFRVSERSNADEIEALKTELASSTTRFDRLSQEHRSFQSLCVDLQSKNDELVAAQQQLEIMYRERLESEQVLRKQLTEELLELRADCEETARLAQQCISAGLNVPTAPLASEELEAAGLHAEGLAF